jgi:hypothetical protein
VATDFDDPPDMKLYSKFQEHNFYRDPAWRWNRISFLANKILGERPGRCSRRDDNWIRRAKPFYQSWTRKAEVDREEMFWKEPALFYAFAMHERSSEAPEGAMILQARLLAGQSYAAIAKTMSMSETAVEWYERLFFNVADYLHQRDWITAQVLLPAVSRSYIVRRRVLGQVPKPPTPDELDDQTRAQLMADKEVDRGTVARPFLDGTLKLFAYFGGPVLVDFLLTGFQNGKPLASADDLDDWLDGVWGNTIRRRSAMAAFGSEINKYNVMELFVVHARLIEIERSADSEGKKVTAQEKHVKAMMDSIPWAFGGKNAELPAGELRADEMVRKMGGEKVEDYDGPKCLPLPRPRPVEVGKGVLDELQGGTT